MQFVSTSALPSPSALGEGLGVRESAEGSGVDL
jgi:hypothetical protein